MEKYNYTVYIQNKNVLPDENLVFKNPFGKIYFFLKSHIIFLENPILKIGRSTSTFLEYKVWWYREECLREEILLLPSK